MTSRFDPTLRMAGLAGLLVMAASCSDIAGGTAGTTGTVAKSSDAVSARVLPQDDTTRAMRASVIGGTTFGRSVKRAVEEHPGIARGDAVVRGARARVHLTDTAYDPQLNIGFDLGYASGATATGNRIGPVVELSKLVYDGAASRIQLRADDEELAIAKADLAIQAAALALEAVQAHINVVQYRALFEIADDNYTALEDLTQRLQERLDAGVGTESDYLTGQSRLATASAKRIETRRLRDQAEAFYRQVFGTAAPAGLALPEAPPRVAREAGRAPQVIRLDYSVNAALLNVDAAHANGKPKVSLSLSAVPVIGAGVAAGQVGGQIGVRHDLLGGERRKALVESLEAKVDEVKAERAQLIREITRALSYAQTDLASGSDRIRAAELSIQANTAAYASAQEQFNVGKRTITQLLDAQNEVTQAREALTLAKAGLVNSSYAALGVTGDILSLFRIQLKEL
jgi:adhesin transport system outer membrane protein